MTMLDTAPVTSAHDDEPVALETALERWTDAGLISSDQAIRIAGFERPAPGSRGLLLAMGRPDRFLKLRGIEPATIVMFFGAFLILFALGTFVASTWSEMGTWEQFGWALAAVVGLGGIGALARLRLGAELAGNLLILVATGAVPLLAYTIERLAGLWPKTAVSTSDRLFTAWIVLEAVSVVVAAVVTLRTRFPLVVVLVAFWSWFLALDVMRWIAGDGKWTWTPGTRWLSVGVGLVIVATAVQFYRQDRRDYALLLAILGSGLWVPFLGTLAFEDEQAVARIMYPILAVGAVVVSVWLQARVFLVAGALALYAYLSYLVFEVFGSGAGVTIGMVVVGLAIVASGVLYQRRVEPWLEQRFGHPA